MEGDAREDDEPSLGSLGSSDGNQSQWGEGCGADLEEQCEDEGGEHDGREPDHDDEPSLCGLGAHERQGFRNDYDGELEPYPDEKNLEAALGLASQLPERRADALAVIECIRELLIHSPPFFAMHKLTVS